jgi:SAM-dependent methyltransferase
MFQEIKERWVMTRLSLKYPGVSDSSTYMKYPKEHTFNGAKVLNMGCGSSTYKAKNVTNLDYLAGKNIDVVWDLNKTPMPFKDGEFDLVIANMVLEHLENWWGCFIDMARVVKPGGTIEVWLPGDGTSSQLGYRDHVSTINSFSFGGIGGGMRNNANIWETEDRKHIGEVSKLELTRYLTRMKMYWWIQIMPQKVRLWMAEHLRNVVSEQGFIFVKERSK